LRSPDLTLHEFFDIANQMVLSNENYKEQMTLPKDSYVAQVLPQSLHPYAALLYSVTENNLSLLS